MDMEYENMIEDFKTMSSLTQNEGRIRLTVVIEKCAQIITMGKR